MSTSIKICLLALSLVTIALLSLAKQGEQHAPEEPDGSITSEQMQLAGIRVETLSSKPIDYQVYAPGEIRANGYTSYLVSPRVESVVLTRHATLGEHVGIGARLVTLFSETVAAAQAQYLADSSEWQRVKSLGRKAVGDKRHVNSSTAYEASRARLIAYGMDEAALLPKLEPAGPGLGEYTLTVKIDGAVLRDDFHLGQRVSPGDALMELANENQLWVEARLPANSRLNLPQGLAASIAVGSNSFAATVAQEAHTIDPTTRTRIVRLLVDNVGHSLHPGMFADVYFKFKTETPVIAVPEEALVRGEDGDWMVFAEDHPGEFEAMEVELGRALGEMRELIDFPMDTRVVTKGAFFVASQLNKSGFDPHNH